MNDQPLLRGTHLRRGALLLVAGGLLAAVGLAYADGWRDSSQAPNAITTELSPDGLRVGGIANTRHNLTMSYSANQAIMDPYRNNYFEICVYCHTPHGANSTAAAPLWNRTISQRTYTLYSANEQSPTMLGRPITQPGPNSLTCLSCHDGATAIDSVINMPTQLTGAYRAGYLKDQETAQNYEFLDQWGADGKNRLVSEGLLTDAQLGGEGHRGLTGGDGAEGCFACHNPNESFAGGTPPDFSAFAIGGELLRRQDVKDADGQIVSYTYVADVTANAALNDDHPIGVKYPTEFGPGVDYNEPDVKQPRIAFFDRNGDNHADPNEIRLYNSGDGYEVECASCHDPHGVPVSYNRFGAPSKNAELIPSFLRVGAYTDNRVTGNGGISGNAGSELCLTCHVK